MLDLLRWIVSNLFQGFVNLAKTPLEIWTWLNWSDPINQARFIYYGGSSEFFFAVFDLFLLFLVIGLFRRSFLWGIVRGIEWFANRLGRFFAWAGLIMVVQQIMIVFLQRIFRVSEISIGPFGYVFNRDLSWFGEELKLYNAAIVCLCCAYTFVQGGHVRVDIFYARMAHRRKKIVDMFGSLFFIMPMTVLIWMFGWYFMWRHLVTPKVSAMDTLQRIEAKSRALKWNVETIGFSPNGFDGYFMFKVLLVSFAGLMFIQGCCYFYRSLLEYLEGWESAGKYHDKDVLNDATAEAVAEIH